ncbi:unnamed protein product [Linum trigynum]|uniref:Uncharacterized protein n=1 Tax=Linum trigynum TaxID=586398 RepID=A0AAV2E8L2_9ROSI
MIRFKVSDSSKATVMEPSTHFKPWLVITKKGRRNNQDHNRKGKDEIEAGKLNQGNVIKNGKNISARKEGEDVNGWPSPHFHTSQRTNTSDYKKEGDELSSADQEGWWANPGLDGAEHGWITEPNSGQTGQPTEPLIV